MPAVMKEFNAQTLLNSHLQLGEGPRVFPDGSLWWVNIIAGQVFSAHLAGGKLEQIRSWELSAKVGMVGALAPTSNGKVLLAAQRGFFVFEPESGDCEFLVNPISEQPKIRFNDGLVDPRGRFVAGTMSLDEEEGAGSLWVLESDNDCRLLLEGVSVSNGLEWSPDGSSFYYIDSPTHCVAVYHYDVDRGEVGERLRSIDLHGFPGVPDGMARDAQGNLWVAFWQGTALRCFNPNSGEHLATVHVDALQVTACAFAGQRLENLVITTASTGIDDDRAGPQEGNLFICDVGVTGEVTRAFQMG